MGKKRSIEHDILGIEFISAINSRRKGKTNEVAVAKFFSTWTGSKFASVPSSGGLRWKDAGDTLGDITCTDRKFFFPFVVEAKFYKSLGIQRSKKLRVNSIIYGFWDQVTRDVARSQDKKYKLLVVRENGMKAGQFYIIVDKSLEIVLRYKVTWLFVGIANDGSKLYGFCNDDLLHVNYNEFVGILK